MPTPKYLAWAWMWPEDQTAFASYGPAPQPWHAKWEARHGCESELNDRLRTLEREPAIAPGIGCTQILAYGTQIRALVRGMQQRLKAEGYRLLTDRDRSTINAGYKGPRPVYVLDGFGKEVWFRSVRAAARALNVDPSLVVLNCQNPTHPWRYAD